MPSPLCQPIEKSNLCNTVTAHHQKMHRVPRSVHGGGFRVGHHLVCGALLGRVSMVRLLAVLTNARCEKACGKLPTNCVVRGSYSSLSRPTSLQSDSIRSNSFRASSRRPSIR